MKKYFIYLNWCQLIAAGTMIFGLSSYLQTAGIIGVCLGLLFTPGYLTLQYCREDLPEKDAVWWSELFNKEYVIEVAAFTFATGFFIAMSFLPWAFISTLFRFVAGCGMVFYSNIIFETIWRFTFYIYINKHRK